jgi:hypothetical protein
MIPIETVLGMADGGKKECDGGWRGWIQVWYVCLIHCKNFYKYHNAPLPSTKIKEKKSPCPDMSQTLLQYSTNFHFQNKIEWGWKEDGEF